MPPIRTVRAAGSAGDLVEAVVFRADIDTDGVRFADVEALSTRRDYAILGRNVLARLVVRLDGPAEDLVIKRPARKRRKRA